MKKQRCSAALLLALTITVPVAGTMLIGCGGGRAMTRSANTVPDDAYITTRVKTALLNDEVITGKIDVDTVGGVVTLTGSVKSAVERDKAVALARKITGVSDVKSAIQIE